jgi:hypothetical protein
MTLFFVAVAVVVVVTLPWLLKPLFMRELARWDRRRFPTGLKLIRVGFGIAAFALYLVMAALLFSHDLGGEFLAWISVIYWIAAGAGYRLLLRLAFLATGSDEYEREVRASEGRIELGLRDSRGGQGEDN